MSDLKPMDWSKDVKQGVPLPDWKIRIRCTKEQWDHFRKHTCPDKFDPNWSSLIHDCCFEVHPDCKKCWDEYVIWEDSNEADA